MVPTLETEAWLNICLFFLKAWRATKLIILFVCF